MDSLFDASFILANLKARFVFSRNLDAWKPIKVLCYSISNCIECKKGFLYYEYTKQWFVKSWLPRVFDSHTAWSYNVNNAEQEVAMARKLYRSRTDRKIWGVCGGLAKYFDMDPTIVRIIFVASLLCGTLGLWVYIIMAIIVPQESEGDTAT